MVDKLKAFPNVTGQTGMDLRDYFAAQAMQALIARGSSDLTYVSKMAYAVADEMMEVRK